jgi:hypothetical protein
MDLNRNKLFIFGLLVAAALLAPVCMRAQTEIEEFENSPVTIVEDYEIPLDSTMLEEIPDEEFSEEEYIIEEEAAEERQPEKLHEKPVWSDEQWKEAVKELEYEREEEKKEEQEEIQEEESVIEPSERFDIGDWLESIFLSGLAKIIVIVVVIILLCFLIIQLTRARMKSAKIKVTTASVEIPENIDEDVSETDLERYLRLALEKSDFKTAVRILYLMTIQRLNELEVIRWKKDKTNRDYLNEMRQRSDYRHFRELTLMYEVVWYGDRGVEPNEFDAVRKAFDQFKSNLGTKDETR